MAKFDLHQLLNERSKAAAVEREKEPRTADGMERLTLDVYDLIPSQENFYSTQYISDLKQSIAIVGLLQPLLVERDGDKFRVVAGHRRRLACMALVEDGLAQFRRVPCVTRAAEEEGTVKTILDRLALIFANGFREKSDWEKMEETLRTEALIAELRKEVEVEGRTRWITAEFTGITEAQIGRYKSIKNNLCPELMQAFKAKRLGVSTAYELSGLSVDYQNRAADTLEEVGVLSINDAKALKQEEEAGRPLEGQMEFDTAAEEAPQAAQEAAPAGALVLIGQGVDPPVHVEIAPVQGQLPDVQVLPRDHQGPHGGGHDDAGLVKAFHVLHAGDGQALPPVQLQAVDGGLGHRVIVHGSSLPVHRIWREAPDYDSCLYSAAASA